MQTMEKSIFTKTIIHNEINKTENNGTFQGTSKKEINFAYEENLSIEKEIKLFEEEKWTEEIRKKLLDTAKILIENKGKFDQIKNEKKSKCVLYRKNDLFGSYIVKNRIRTVS